MRYALALVFLCCVSLAVRAELPSPRFDRINPLGGAAGSNVQVQVLGNELDDLQALVFDHAGITARPTEAKDLNKDRRFSVTIDAEVPEGTYDARLITRWGVSSPRQFAVTHGLADQPEKEPNNDPATAQFLSLNSALNGQSDGNDRDLFRLTLKAQERITIDCQSSRLDVQLDAVMQVLAADGKQLASSGDYFGRDPFIDFTAPADGDYLVVVHDLSYRGGLPYRLIVSNRPQIENVFPRAIQMGQSAEITLFGRNFNGRSEATLTVAPPTDAAIGKYLFLEHPTAHSVAPTAATCTLSGFQFRPDLGGPALNAATILLANAPVSVEQEPNDTLDAPQAITLPAVLSGRFDQLRDADWFEFTVPENGQYAVDVYCERIAGQADPYVVFVDEKGNRFQELDDFGIRTNAFDGHIRDCSGMVNLSAKQKYKVLVQDRYHRGGPRYQYVLSLRKPQPDFFVSAIHHQNPGPGGTTLRAGSAVLLDLIIHTTEGYRGPITISAENLPPGVHCQPTTIHNNHGAMLLYADESAANFDGPIRLIASGKRGEETITRDVRPYTRVWQDNPGSSRPTRQQFLSVRETAPFGLQWDSDRLTVEAGKKVDAHLTLKRHWPDFTGPLSLQTFAFPGQIKAGTPQIAAGSNDATVTFEVQAGTPPGDYTLTLLGQAQVPFTKDPMKPKGNTLVTLPCRPIAITVTAAPK